MLIWAGFALIFIMDFEERLRRANLLERSVEMALQCMKLCDTSLKDKLEDRDSECIRTFDRKL